MAGFSIDMFTDVETAQLLKSKCGIQRLLDWFQVDELSSLTEKTGIPLERWKTLQRNIWKYFGCSWLSVTELETNQSSLASYCSQTEADLKILEYIKSTVIVEVAGRSNCGKSELVYRIASFALLHMPVYLFTTSKRAAWARLTRLCCWNERESMEHCYDRLYIVECIDFYTLCSSLQALETCLECNGEQDWTICKAMVLIDGLHIAQMLRLDCTFHERMSWMDLFILLLKRIANHYRCSIVVTNTLDKKGEPMFTPRWSYCPDVHILLEKDDSVQYQDSKGKLHLTITSRWHPKHKTWE